MKHIHTFESFLNEAESILENVEVANWKDLSILEYLKIAKKMNYNQLVPAMEELQELFRTTGDKAYAEVYAQIWGEYFEEKAAITLIPTGKPLEAIHKTQYGTEPGLVGKFPEVPEKNQPIRATLVKVDSFSGKTANVTVLEGEWEEGKKEGYSLPTRIGKGKEVEELKGKMDITWFAESYWQWTKEGSEWYAKFPKDLLK